MDPGVSHRQIIGKPSSLVTILFYILVEEEWFGFCSRYLVVSESEGG